MGWAANLTIGSFQIFLLDETASSTTPPTASTTLETSTSDSTTAAPPQGWYLRLVLRETEIQYYKGDSFRNGSGNHQQE